MTSKKDMMNELYTGALITAGLVGVSYASKKFTKDSLRVPSSLNGLAKLTAAIGVRPVGVKLLQDRICPKENFRINKWQA